MTTQYKTCSTCLHKTFFDRCMRSGFSVDITRQYSVYPAATCNILFNGWSEKPSIYQRVKLFLYKENT